MSEIIKETIHDIVGRRVLQTEVKKAVDALLDLCIMSDNTTVTQIARRCVRDIIVEVYGEEI